MSVNVTVTGTPAEALEFLRVMDQCAGLSVSRRRVADVEGRPGLCSVEVTGHLASEMDELADRIRAAAAAPVS